MIFIDNIKKIFKKIHCTIIHIKNLFGSTDDSVFAQKKILF
jgi:hypothetical protein